MLAALAVAAHLVAAQPLAGRVPRMTAPVVHIRAVKQVRLSSLPWLNRLGHLQNAVGAGFVIDSSGGNALILDGITNPFAGKIVVNAGTLRAPGVVHSWVS
jgi:autotransporter-associated beta strand protein